VAFASTTLKQNSKGGEVTWLEQKLSDLSYRPGPVDGVFDRRTREAVIAFQKWEGLKRDGVVGSEVWWRLLAAERPTPAYAEEGRNNAPEGKWIEVDKSKQVLMYCVDGVVERTLAVSTGSASVGIVTPSGMFFVQRENTWERYRYKPLYLSKTRYLAIHGYKSVPTYPASHGCIRMTRKDMDEFHDLIPIGTPVLVY
jgi:peptidoglycan hydrolase-like protein with peptidoglycan-binding domain